MQARSPAEDHLVELWAKVEAFFARVSRRHPEELACRAGCDDCCTRQLTATSGEAAAIVRGRAALEAPARAALARRGGSGDTGACAALGGDGLCGIYAFRPLVCRSHGLPIRFPAEQGRRSLPLIDACPKNFGGVDLASLSPEVILDQGTLSTVLAAIDAAHADATGTERGRRFDLAELLAGTDATAPAGA